VLSAYRASVHTSTGYTPNMLFLNREVRMPLDLIMGLPVEVSPPQYTADDFVQQTRERAEECYEVAREHLQTAAERRKKMYDLRVKKQEFQTGDWVWYWYPRRFQRKSPKWQRMYVGPYLIVRVIEPVNYVLQKSAHAKPFVVHGDKLKRCFSETPKSWLPSATTNDDSSSDRESEQLLYATHNAEASGPQERDPAKILKSPRIVDAEEISDGKDDARVMETGRPRRHDRRPPAGLKDYVCQTVRIFHRKA
jgi:hypothetical protein